MPSVPFCNLSEVWPDWSQQSNKLNLKKSQQSQQQNQSDQSNQSQQLNQSNQSQQLNQSNQQQSQQPTQPQLQTFKDAENCIKRNNQFQDQVAQNYLQVPSNPLNPSSPYPNGSGHHGQYNFIGPYGYNTMGYPIYPIYNQWPPQMWNPYQMVSPYDNSYQRQFDFYDRRNKKDGKMIENFQNIFEYFGTADKGTQLLNIVIFVLILMFVIQFVELVCS